MSRLESLDASSWEGFVASPASVLVLGKSDCEACARWTAELEAFLESDSEFPEVRFAKMLLDRPGLVWFKRGNPWVAEVDVLPFNAIYANGARVKSFAGSGVERLQNRLRRLAEASA